MIQINLRATNDKKPLMVTNPMKMFQISCNKGKKLCLIIKLGTQNLANKYLKYLFSLMSFLHFYLLID